MQRRKKTLNVSPSIEGNANAMKKPKLLQDISQELHVEARKIRRIGIFVAFAGLLLTCALFWFLYAMTVNIFTEISDMHMDILVRSPNHSFDDLESIILYLSFRSLVFGGIGGYTIYFIFRFSKSCFDQSIRFTKRKHATDFLDYISLKETDLNKKMTAFHIWNLAVESAFSDKGKESDNNPNLVRRMFGAEADKTGATVKAEV